jgi:23S rRNA U2552 (ribose-2'-O)-methylase RlmE/FtsJ
MSFYQIPKGNFFISKYIDYIENNKYPTCELSQSLTNYLSEIKEHISKIENDWDIYKKYTNPYEYIHSKVPYKKKCVSKYVPLSRSYFKMLEMIAIFDLQFSSKPINTFHLAEGPGGFIEAMVNTRNRTDDTYIGMTIIDTNPNVPSWKKSERFLKQHPNVKIETGADKTGNLLRLKNLEYCHNKYGSSMDLITGDGGFDFSIDFNKQEYSIAKLLFAQVCYALTMQKYKGTFILKLFDCFMLHTLDILYILSSFYEKVYIIKPYTSRHANSERYIVCKGFLHTNNKGFYSLLHNTFRKMLMSNDNFYTQRFLSYPIPYIFRTKIEEINAILGQQQIENIYYTISLIEQQQSQEKINTMIRNNIKKCISWCNKHNVPQHTL